MRFKYQTSAAERGGIDMTPFVDIVFNLLLFFLLSSSYVQHSSLEVKLPTAKTSTELVGEPVVVELTSDDRLFLKNEELSFFDLETRLREIYASDEKERPLLVRADAYAYHVRIVAILDLARQLGVKSLNIETMPGTEAVTERPTRKGVD